MKKLLSLFFIFFIMFACGCSKKTYTATFKDSDGSVLKVLEVPIAEAPVFEGIPEKESDDTYDYKFYSWDKELAATDKDTTYTAIYVTSVKNEEEEVIYVDDIELDELRGDVNNELLDDSMMSESFFVTFLDDDNHTILQKTEFKYGSTPYFEGGSPASKVVGDYIYTFIGWDKSFTTVKGAQTYVAQYKKEKIQNNNTSSTDSSSSSSSSTQKQGNYVLSSTDKVLDYTVTLKAFDISNNQEGGGTFTGAGSYNANAKAFIEAIPNKGMHFVKWSDGDTSATKSFIVKSNVEYTAYFEKDNEDSKNLFRVAVKSSDLSAGIVEINPSRADNMYEAGENVTISATPNTGYLFKCWIDSNSVIVGESSDLQLTFEVTKDVSYTAIFIKEEETQQINDNEEGKVTVSASVDNNKVAYVTINDEVKSSLNVDIGTNVDIKVYLTSASAKFLGWSETNNRNLIFNTQQSIHLDSVQKDTTYYAFTESEGTPEVIINDDPAPEIKTIESLIKCVPDGACSFIVDGSSDLPKNFVIGKDYKIEFVQNSEQSSRYKFKEWKVGSSATSNSEVLNLLIADASINQVVAYFTDNNDYSGGGEEGNPVDDLNNLKIGDVITFNDDDTNKYLLIDTYTVEDKLIGKVVPINFNYSSQYSFYNMDKTINFSNLNLMTACSSYADNLTNPILKNHLYSTNINIYDYLNTDVNNSYSVHKSIIDNTNTPTEPITSYYSSCYPLGLGELDKFYTYRDKKGIYSANDLKNFIKFTTGNSNNRIWLKDLVSYNTNQLNTGICISNDGINTASISTDMNFLPVLLVDIDSLLKVKKIPDLSIPKTNKYTITFASNTPEYGTVEVDNLSYQNVYEEGDEINFSFKNFDSSLYKFIKWSDNNTNPSRSIKASEDIKYTAYAGFEILDFNKNFDIIPFIKSNGKQYINTDYKPTKDTKIVLQYEPILENETSFTAICGLDDGTNKLETYITNSINGDTHNTTYKLNSNSLNVDSTEYVSGYEELTITAKKLSIKNFDGSNKDFSINSELTFNGTELPLYLFASNVKGTANGLSKIKLYSCKIYEDNKLVRDMVPVSNNSTSDIKKKHGLFDLIESIYYPSLYQEDFIAPSNGDLLFGNFKQIDYIQNNGESFIDTGVNPDLNTGFSIEFMPLSKSTANYFGVVSGDSKLTVGTNANTATSNYFSLNLSYRNILKTQDLTLNDKFSIIKTYVSYNFLKDGNVTYSTTDGFNSSSQAISNIIAINKSIHIGTAHDDSNTGPVRIYSALITSNKSVSHYYIPVETNDASKFGLLDICDGKFIDLSNTSFNKNTNTDNISDFVILPRVMSDGKAYINTGIKFNKEGTVGIKASFIPLGFNDAYYIGTLKSNENYIGANLENKDKVFFANALEPYENEYVVEQGKPMPVTVKYNYLNSGKFESSNSDKNLTINSDVLKVDEANSTPILIGHVNEKLENQAPAIYYNFSISKGNNVVQYLVPAKYNLSNEIGFYDVINGEFYRSDNIYSAFIDGSFTDSTECTITSTIESPVILKRALYSNSNLENKIGDAEENQKCQFLSTLNLEVVPQKNTDDNKMYTIDKWSDNDLCSLKRNIIVYSTNSQNYSASVATKSMSSINISFVDIEGKTINNNHVKVTFKRDDVPVTDGAFYAGDKIQVEMIIGGVDGYEKYNSTELYKWHDPDNKEADKVKKIDTITVKEDDKEIMLQYTLYPAQTFFMCKVVDANGNELPQSDFEFTYYSKYDPFRSSKRTKIEPTVYYPNFDEKGVEMITGLNDGDTVYCSCTPKTDKKYMTVYGDSSSGVSLFPVKIKANTNNYKTFTFINYIVHGDDLISEYSDSHFDFETIANIRNSSGWKYTTSNKTTPVSNELKLNKIADDDLKVGDIIRFDSDVVPNTLIFDYPLYCNTTGEDIETWAHTSNLYRVIKKDDNKVELMDLTCRDQLMINRYEVNKLHEHDFTNNLYLYQYSFYKDAEDHINHEFDYFQDFYRFYKSDTSLKWSNFNYINYGTSGNINYELEILGYSDDTYLKASQYILGSYYNNMPQFLKDAIIPQNKYLYTYNSNDKKVLKAAPYLTRIERTSDVYILGLQDILDYIGFNYKNYNLDKSIDLLLSSEQQNELYEMFGFSNKFLDYSSFRYSSVPVNFLIWDYVSSNPTIKNNQITNKGSSYMNSEGWLTVKLKNTFNGTNNLTDLVSNTYHQATIECINSSNFQSGLEYSNFDIIRPCFTVDLNKINKKYKKVTNSDYLEKNTTEVVYESLNRYSDDINVDDKTLASIRNSSPSKYTTSDKQTEISNGLELVKVNVADINIGDIIRFDNVPNTKIINYPLYCNTDGSDMRTWNHTSNLYRVIKKNGNLLELMDLTCTDQIMLDQTEINSLKKYSYFSKLSRITPKDYEPYKYYEVHWNNGEIDKKDGLHKVSYRSDWIAGGLNTYLRISKYLLNSYYYNMPSTLKSAIVPQTKYIYSYPSGHNNYYPLEVEPYPATIELDQKVYLLGLQDVLDYLGVDVNNINKHQSIEDVLTDNQKSNLYKMFGFSNKFLDYSSFRYSSIPVNFLLWNYITKNAAFDNTNKFKKFGDLTLYRDGCFNIGLEKVFNYSYTETKPLQNDITESQFQKAIIQYTHTVNNTQDQKVRANFTMIRPCFTVDFTKLNGAYKKVNNPKYLEENTSMTAIKYEP